MKTYSFAEALQLLKKGAKVSREGTYQKWHLLWVSKPPQIVSTVPFIIRVAKKGRERAPWPPIRADIFGKYVNLTPGIEFGVFAPNSIEWAYNDLLKGVGADYRRTDWVKGLHVRRVDEENIRLILPNGTPVSNDTYHPDMFDMARRWEKYEP